MRHERLLQLLQDREIQLPVVYEMEWYEPENAWVGCCKDLPEPEIAVILSLIHISEPTRH